MEDVPDKIQAWQMVQPWVKNRETGEVTEGKLEKVELPVPELKPGEVLVKVAGCGVCHTDLGYFYYGVPTVNKPPLTLGHEITGTVVAGEQEYIGKDVIIPAVMPCNNCEICQSGRGNRCLVQKMPGNSLDIYGGFSSHIPVPAANLCIVGDTGEFKLEELAVIADAITTPYQACTRGNVTDGDNVIIIGTGGGVGVYTTQMVKAFGAKTVIGIDIDDEKLERALKFGADFVINSKNKDPKTVKDEFKNICKSNNLPHNYGWKIFEVTGSGAGQAIALNLLSFVSKLIWVGFGMQKNEYSLSKLMAYDAEIIGTWGCLPEYYPKVLSLVKDGKVQVKPFIDIRPMSGIKEAFEEAHSGKLLKRIILTPDF
ncbi:6-hydroxycyclohex-1-ene-1-carbonyl-CoA dehydrogenase [[Eubacterium] cellulosolvens]